MDRFKFTKSYIQNEKEFQKVNVLKDVERLEKIYQNMQQQQNKQDERLNVVKQEQQIDNLSDRMSALKNINRN